MSNILKGIVDEGCDMIRWPKGSVTEAWLGSFKTRWNKTGAEVFVNPSRQEFTKLMKQWGTAARALITKNDDLVFWHMDDALHSEAASFLHKTAGDFIPAHIILYAPNHDMKIVWNELENFIADEHGVGTAEDHGYTPLLKKTWLKVINNPYLNRIYGKVYPWGLNESRTGDYFEMTEEWMTKNIHGLTEGDVIQGPWKNTAATQKTNAAKLASEFLSSEYAPNDLEDEDIEDVAEYIVEFLLKHHEELTGNMDIDDIDILAKRISHEAFIQSDLLDEALEENLNKWFKEKWVRFGPDGKIRGACARGDDSEGKPKCLPQKKAQNLGKKGRKYAASKKRREDPNPERTGKAKNVATKKKTNEEQLDELKCWSGYTRVQGVPAGAPGSCKKKTNEELGEKCPHCGGELVSEEMMNEKQDACYRKVKSRYKVWPSAYASGALVQCRKKGASNWGTGGKKDESSIMKGIVSEAFNPKQRAEEIKKIVSFIVRYIGDDPSDSAIADAAKYEADRSKAEYDAKRSDGFLSSDDIFEPLWNHFREPTLEASSPAQQAAIAINMKKKGQKPKNDVQEDYTGEFAAEKTPAINPYGGRPDRQFRGAISETPNTSGPIGTQPGGWRTYKATPAGEIEEDTAYAGGMGQGGDAGQSYRKFTPKMAGVIKKESSIMKGLRKEGR